MTEHSPEALKSAQHRIQQVVAALALECEGTPPSDVAERLTAELLAAGIPEQPQKWVGDTAIEISAGRLVIMNQEEMPEEVERLEPDPDQHAAG